MAINWPSQYRWPPQRTWLEPLRSALSEFVPIQRMPLQQPSSPVVVFKVHWGGAESCEIAVDYSDYTNIDETLARSVPLYLKMQYLSRGYGIPSVIPGGYPYSPQLPALLGGVRRLAALPQRQVVFGRFAPNNAVRRQAAELLHTQQRFTFDGGLVLRRYGRHLAEAARAAICLDMPGRGPLCFRLVDYLAAGCCIVSPRHEASLHVPLRDGVHVTHVEPDLSNLVDVCDSLLGDAERRRRLGAAAADFFDRHLESRQLAAYYMSEILARVP
jgi:glycosyl transferase family 1